MRIVRKLLPLGLLVFLLPVLCGCGGRAEPSKPSPSAETPRPVMETSSPVSEPGPQESPAQTPEPTPGERIRVGIAIDRDLSLDEGVLQIEDALGHKLDVVWQFETAHAISAWLAPEELETVRSLEAVVSAEEELLNAPNGVTVSG